MPLSSSPASYASSSTPLCNPAPSMRGQQRDVRSINKSLVLPAIDSLKISESTQLGSPDSGTKILPASYELVDSRDLVVLITNLIMELISINDKIPLHQHRLTRFHSRSPPHISVHDYLRRLVEHANLPPSILLSIVYYIDLLCDMYPGFAITSLTVHRFLIASAMVASKALNDTFWTNQTYARIGGVSPTELAMLELEFLFRVKWQIVPNPESLINYYHSLVERCGDFEIEHPAL
ncbi:hypothetical protein PENANT_c146G03311 [Penicillium antarcticum]|uniref:Cyclin n=1 Tax=Penicillium antarcticum TaxID=416450 RepID=A0A1V6PFR1_9EURO|nr:uncharacterized protein N7508_007328 [Penicillium antarcticum]KAJ5300085.1 hypothetical protein N7508_007328 [Penicillium antarcticum]OQD75855.1 hypothetical protein PENANT_c146G03311 [Penicillium antarcticum]